MKGGFKMKFAFKKMKKEGRFRSFQKDVTDIKINKKVVGHITENDDFLYSVSFSVKKQPTKSDPATFKWVVLKKKFESEKEARDYIQNCIERIVSQLDIYSHD